MELIRSMHEEDSRWQILRDQGSCNNNWCIHEKIEPDRDSDRVYLWSFKKIERIFTLSKLYLISEGWIYQS